MVIGMSPREMGVSDRGYTHFALRHYHLVDLAISNTFAWHCPTHSSLLPFFQEHIGKAAHIEIGVGLLSQTMRGKDYSVALFYLFHCLPGVFPKKATDASARVKAALAPGGVVYGATVLGMDVTHNWLGTRSMNFYHN
ncbi:hypothetical protein C8Q77DRAFT_1076866 [Trametes polyzona]|nr:hypothetical protein C8Q77DRAFT_1076866 [Trametes polyzona]